MQTHRRTFVGELGRFVLENEPTGEGCLGGYRRKDPPLYPLRGGEQHGTGEVATVTSLSMTHPGSIPRQRRGYTEGTGPAAPQKGRLASQRAYHRDAATPKHGKKAGTPHRGVSLQPARYTSWVHERGYTSGVYKAGFYR